MTHLDEGTIVALRDRQPAVHAARAHLEACDRCRARVEDARGRSRLVEDALRALDGLVETDEAKARVRARMDARIARQRSPAWHALRAVDLRRAAVILLVTAGAVSALPGAPLHRWLTADPTATVSTGAVSDEAPQDAARAAIMVALPESGVRILIHASAPLRNVEVVWTDDADVRLDAPTGSRFTYGEGRIEATVAGGAVRIELPREGAPVHVEVDGRVYLSRTPGGVVLDAPVAERSEERILFGQP